MAETIINTSTKHSGLSAINQLAIEIAALKKKFRELPTFDGDGSEILCSDGEFRKPTEIPQSGTEVGAADPGVYFLHTNGHLYKMDQWVFPMDKCVGISVIDEYVQFTVAPITVSGAYAAGGNRIVQGVTTTNDVNVAYNNFEGYTNTIAFNQNEPSELMSAVLNYKFANERTGYCPGVGELLAAAAW